MGSGTWDGLLGIDDKGGNKTMTTLIKLTKPEISKIRDHHKGTVYINPANIIKVFESPEFDGNTVIVFDGGGNCLVKESPYQIADMIFKAEHPECKL